MRHVSLAFLVLMAAGCAIDMGAGGASAELTLTSFSMLPDDQIDVSASP